MQKGKGVYGECVETPIEEFEDIVAMRASVKCNILMQNYKMMAKYVDTFDAEFEPRIPLKDGQMRSFLTTVETT
jgi:hypothetical protein